MECEICNKTYSTPGNLNKHKRQVHDLVINYKCECGTQYDNYQSLNAHYRHCIIHRKGKIPIPPWQKGKPNKHKGKKYEEYVNDSEKAKRLIRESLQNCNRDYDTEEYREKLSKARINYLENNSPHVKWFEVGGIKVQGNWERMVAEKLLNDGIIFSRIRIKYDSYRTYTPDFFLNDFNMYIEVKGWMKDGDIEKYSKVLLENDIDLRLIEGKLMLNKFINGTLLIKDLPKFTPP